MSEWRGHFGLNLEHMVPGLLRIEDDRSFVLEVEDFIFVPQQLDLSQPNRVAYSTDPEKIVADFMPRDILGILDGNEPVSLMGALMDDPSFPFLSVAQSFHGDLSLLGAHLNNEHALISGLRWTWPVPDLNRLSGTEGPARVGGERPGSLTSWAFGAGAGLQFTAGSPTPLRVMLNEVLGHCSQIVGLWCAQEVPGVSCTEVLVEDRWCTLHMRNQQALSRIRTQLMPIDRLSIATFAMWLPMANEIFPFPYIVNAPTNILQLDAQVLGTVVEGLHYRLHGRGARLDGMSQSGIRRATDIARRTGVEALMAQGYTDEDEAQKAFRETLGHLNDMTYQARALELFAPVHDLVPSLFGPDLTSWVEMVKQIRNHQSHQAAIQFNESLIARYYVTVESCRWALRLRMLIQLLPNYDYKAILTRSSRFQLALANIDREEIWPDFSALKEFRAGV